MCETAPSFESALADGTVSAGHVDALAAATKRLDVDLRNEFFTHEPLLLAAAAGGRSVDEFSRECRDLARQVVAFHSPGSDAEELDRQRAASKVTQWVDKTTGMCTTLLSMDPLSHAKMMTAVNASLARLRRMDGKGADRTPWQRLQVEAFLDALTGGRAGVDDPNVSGGGVGGDGDHVCGEPEQRIPEVIVLVDAQTLIDGLHDHSICETDDGFPIPMSTIRRLACDGEIISTLLGANGAVLDAGRSTRSANRAQRRRPPP